MDSREIYIEITSTLFLRGKKQRASQERGVFGDFSLIVVLLPEIIGTNLGRIVSHTILNRLEKIKITGLPNVGWRSFLARSLRLLIIQEGRLLSKLVWQALSDASQREVERSLIRLIQLFLEAPDQGLIRFHYIQARDMGILVSS